MLRKKFLAFACVGGVATAIHYGVLIVTVNLFGVSAVWGSSLGFAVSAVANYTLNYYYTFKSNRPHADAALRFIVISSLGLALNGAIMKVGVDGLGGHYILVQLGATGVVLVWNFFGSYLWSFRDHARRPSIGKG